MKCCIVAIAKYEGDYIKEWVDYNFNLGFDHIIIGDNNNDHTENLYDILHDYIIEGKLTLINLQGTGVNQVIFYENTYKNLLGNFDWVLFYDIDEFLILNTCKNVHEYLSRKCFDNFDVIKVNWKVMSNNGYAIYIDKPVLERFTKPGNNFLIADNIYVNNTVKSFYRTSKNLIPHVHCTEKHYDNIRYCDCSGNEIIDKSSFPNWSQYLEYTNFSEAYIKHFVTKSLEEYIKYKIKRGWSCWSTPERKEYVLKNCLNLEQFEKMNGKSKLYEKLFDEFCIKYNINNN